MKSAFLVTRLAHGDKHGYDRHSIREPLASFFYDHRYAISKQQHAVERIRQLFAKSLGYACPTQQGDYAIARHFYSQKKSIKALMSFSCTQLLVMISTGLKKLARTHRANGWEWYQNQITVGSTS